MKIIRDGSNQLLVDNEDFKRVIKYTWNLAGPKKDILQATVSGESISIARFILDYYGPMLIDHIDRDIWNNQKSNFRFANQQQNGVNSGPRLGKKYKGTSNRGSSFRAAIQVNGKNYYKGPFTTEIEAAKAYDRLALKHFGEFAYLNFPKEKK